MDIFFNEADVERAARELIANSNMHESEPGSMGAQARIMAQVMVHWHLAVVRELNRGTDVADMAHAVACIGANFFLSVAGSVGGDAADKAGLLNWMLAQTAMALTDRLGGKHDGNRAEILPLAGGRA